MRARQVKRTVRRVLRDRLGVGSAEVLVMAVTSGSCPVESGGG